MIEQLATASDAGLLAEVVELEAELARLRYRQLSVLAELNSRNVPSTLGFRGLSDLIGAQLRCTRAEARKRYLAVERFGARRALTGEPLEPRLPGTAGAFAAGEIGSEHAAAVAEVVEAIPTKERAEHAGPVESTLLEHARTSDRARCGSWVSGSWRIWIRMVRRRGSGGCSRPTAGCRCRACLIRPGCWMVG